ncbi:MAG: hypothetical protein EBT26_07680 [Microbacteriaceae bacterium]|nr:hypothetical protein [Microbacteriaceae bacterium]
MDELIDDSLPFDLTPHEDITACIQAMGVIEDMDTLLLSEEEAEMIEQIKKMSLLITHQALSEIFEANKYGNNKPTQG